MNKFRQAQQQNARAVALQPTRQDDLLQKVQFLFTKMFGMNKF